MAVTSCQVHGVMLNIAGTGVLLTGESGVGKSLLALELLSRGQQLIADDRVDFTKHQQQLIGSCPPILHGLLEVRGAGIVDVGKMFGTEAIGSPMPLALQIDLINLPICPYPSSSVILGLEIARLPLLPNPHISSAVLVEAMCRNLRIVPTGTAILEHRQQTIRQNL